MSPHDLFCAIRRIIPARVWGKYVYSFDHLGMRILICICENARFTSVRTDDWEVVVMEGTGLFGRSAWRFETPPTDEALSVLTLVFGQVS